MIAKPAAADFSLGQFIRMQRARMEREGLQGPEGEHARLLAEFSHTTDAASLLRADIELPPERYAFLDALIGVAGGNVDWFEATDARIAKRAGKSTKWVQRERNKLTEWQQRHNYNLVDVEDHYTDASLRRHPHKYRVHLHRLAVEARLEAEASPHWSDPKRRGFALQQAARLVRDSVPEWEPRKHRGRRRDPDALSIINRSLKAAATNLEKAVGMIDGVELGRLARGQDSGVRVEAETMARLRSALTDLEGRIGESAAVEQPGGQESPQGNSLVENEFLPSGPERTASVEEVMERAAIMEFDGRVSREVAEAMALAFGGGG